MHDILTAALDRVNRDLVSTVGWSLPVHDEPWHDVPGRASAWLTSVTGSRTGVFVDEVDDPQVRVVALAEQVQDFVHEELPARGMPAVWPACPLHPGTHPLAPTLHEGRAWWVCPRTRQAVRAIGARSQ